MPEAIRARIFANCADLGRLLSAAITTCVAVAASSATALGADFLRGSALSLLSGLTQLERHEVVALALTIGVISFAVFTAVLLVRTRTRASQRRTVRKASSAERASRTGRPATKR